ncbi:hypothetical protein COL516b_008879 [Colletotrichum fioriniae]|nr:uncharacterized protein COL516b_008879 [Colletotrichum fioriniae]KAJ0299762.1 hypothetical protein COL516b_008879 [Colletotrichum fioriniae]
MPSNPQLTTISTIKDRDAHVDHIDYQEIPKDGGTKVQADKFGSVAKVDPKEIALVRKLDTYLMPILWLMYFLNFLDRNAIVNGKLNNLDKDLNMKGSELVLGLTEAPFYSGACYLVSLFYTRKEVATRLAVFYTGNLLASSFSGLIAAGVFAGLDGRNGLAGWRWLFLIQGVVTSKAIPQNIAEDDLR